MAHLTAAQLQDLFTVGGLFADLDAWFLHQIEMAACGTRRSFLYDWIMSNSVNGGIFKDAMTTQKTAAGPSLLQPFILAKQETIVNGQFWKVTCGVVKTAYTTDADVDNTACNNGTSMTGPLDVSGGTGGDRVIRLESRYGMPCDKAFFLVAGTIHIFTQGAGSVSQHGQWKVISANHASDLSYCDVRVQSQNAGSDESYETAPTDGVVIPGINNVNDYENFRKNGPTIDPRKRVLFFYQTWRYARSVEDEYLKVYNRLRASNRAFEEFGDLDLTARNAQDEDNQRRAFVNAFFFNKAISANQTKDLWENLEAINTVDGEVLHPGQSGKIMARRANFVGVRQQLRECDQVKDLANNTLNFYEWINDNYALMRARRSSTRGGQRTVNEIDWYTNRFFAAQLQRAFFAYYKQESADTLRANVQLDQKRTVDKAGSFPIEISFSSYPLVFPAGLRINIIVDDAFDDWYDQFKDQSMSSVGNYLLALDIGKPGIGTMYYCRLSANRKQYRSATIDQLAQFDATYRGVMNYTQETVTLTSETGTVIVECPKASEWIEGIASTIPDITGADAAPADKDLY